MSTVFALLLALAAPASAGTLSSVTLPDTVTVGGSPLVLNGMGLREKYYIDVYVGGLYLPAKTKSATDAINQDVPKRIVMAFIYNGGVTKDQIVEVTREGFAKQSGASALQAKLDTLCGMFVDVGPGDQIVYDYVPGTGVTVTVKGKVAGTIDGADFMKALWTVYLGPNPPTANLKNGMLGN